MNQKGFAKVTLLVVLVVVLVVVLAYFTFFKKPGEVAISPTPTPTKTTTPTPDETANWKTYINSQYGFFFKYPSNVFAYDVVDYTNGQIPDIAGFGYAKPDQYELGDRPAEKMGSARILVWTNVSQDLKSWAQIHEPNIKRADTKVGSIVALVNYSKATTASEGSPMTFKTYYLKTGNEIIEITGFSVTNQYSDSWIVNFDKIVATFKFTNSGQWTKAQFPPNDYHHSVNIMFPSAWVWDCCGDTDDFSAHYTYPRSSATNLDASPIIVIYDFVLTSCPDGEYSGCGMEELSRVTASQFMNSLIKHLDKDGEVAGLKSLRKTGLVKLSNFTSDVPVYRGASPSNQPADLYLIQSAKGVIGVEFQQPQNFDPGLKMEFLNKLTSN